jgi:hypothetical protein
MVASVPSFIELYYHLEEYQDREEHAHAYRDVLLPWLPQALEAMDVLAVLGTPEAMAWEPDHADPCSGGDPRRFTCRERLYPLSRISDLLLLPQQRAWDYLHPPLPRWTPESAARHEEWMRGVGIPRWIPAVTLEERNAWLRALGLVEFQQPTFHPFYHEIVEVEPASDPDEPISLQQVLWPGFLLGQMLFCRAGVRIRAGEHVVQKDLAEHSRMYWTFVRRNRPTDDASHGWGHNSRWSTSFRRDYVDEAAYHYNVDGDLDVHDERTRGPGYPPVDGDDPLGVASRIELLTHRCFVRTPERFYNEDFDDVTYQEPR